MNAGPESIDQTTIREIVLKLVEMVRTSYVFPDIAEQICTRLQQHLQDGEYGDIGEGELLAYALTTHMQEVNHDEHLWVKWHPDPLPEGEGPLRHNQEWQEERKLEARLDNYGLHRVERLPGNVGYIDLRYFHRPAWGGATAVAAMNLVAHTDALIFDLRQCPGGYPGMIALFCSYLFGEEALHLDSIYWRDDDITQQYWTLPYVPGPRFVDKPVYVLTSQVTFSGGEAFAYLLQARRRATVVGEKTDGGANPGTSYPLHPHLELFVPIGRAVNPVTGTNWEGWGVLPDIAVPSEQALSVAYRLALESVIKGIGEPTAAPLQVLRKEAQKALEEAQR